MVGLSDTRQVVIFLGMSAVGALLFLGTLYVAWSALPPEHFADLVRSAVVKVCAAQIAMGLLLGSVVAFDWLLDANLIERAAETSYGAAATIGCYMLGMALVICWA